VTPTSAAAKYTNQTPTNIADGNAANLPFETLEGGPDLLDRTDPANPTFLADGRYIITANPGAQLFKNTDGGHTEFSLNSPGLAPGSPCQATAMPGLGVDLCAGFEAQAGDPITVGVYNADGAQAVDFLLNVATIVKLP